MSEIFFTSDTHFCHDKKFLYEPRGFKSIEEMNEAIVENWNKVVKPHDTVYHLGDTMLNDNEKGIEYFKRLNGEIFLIWGNHDTFARQDAFGMEPYLQVIGGWYSWLIKYGKTKLYLSHYPTLTACFDDKKFSKHVINLHGHTHQQKNFISPVNPFIYHVGLDSHNCTPVHIDEVMTDIRQRWEEIGQLPSNLKPEDTYPYNSIIGGTNN